MDDIYGIRRANFASLLASRPLADLPKEVDRAARLDIGPSMWSQLKNPAYKIGDSIARQIETQLGLEYGWMDQSPSSGYSGGSTESKRNPLTALVSQSVRIQPETMLIAWQWVRAFETAEGAKWPGLKRMQVLADVYEELVADGGQLSDDRHDEYLKRMDLSVQRRNGGSDERGKGDGSEAAGAGGGG